MGKKILIVDDDSSIVESLKYVFEDAGFTVESYEDGSFVKNHFNSMKPDVILLDYWLPGENGGDITKKLKAHKDTKNIPVLIISASYNIRELVKQAGADDFIPKPYDIDDLVNKVESYISK